MLEFQKGYDVEPSYSDGASFSFILNDDDTYDIFDGRTVVAFDVPAAIASDVYGMVEV